MQYAPKISLVLCTLGRTEQLRFFLDNAATQTYRHFELVVVDQNLDDRVGTLLANYTERLDILHLRCEPGLSRARNVGLKSCTGKVIAFPDDDCWYPPELLARVVQLLDSNYDGVTGRQIDDRGQEAGSRYDQNHGFVDLYNVWGRGISSCIFLKRHVVEAVGDFDETLGVGAGTPYGSGEETDYLIRVVKHRFQLYYLPDLFVGHPPADELINPSSLRRAYLYGAGMGRVLSKHHYPFWFKARSLTRPLLGAALALASFHPKRARLHWTRCLGRSRGMLGQHPTR